MDPIICSKDTETVISAIKDYLRDETKSIKDILLIEHSGTQLILLVDNKPIQKDSAKIWWSGYSEGLRIALDT